jgi:hypothetical protein
VRWDFVANPHGKGTIMTFRAIVRPLVICAMVLAFGVYGTQITSACGQDSPVEAASFDAQSSQIVADLVAGSFDEVRARFDATLTDQLSEGALANAWRTYQEVLGAYQSVGQPTSVMRGELTVEQVPVQLANAPGEIRITFHPDGTVAGLFFLTAGNPVP